MNEDTLAEHLEALLFARGGAVSKKDLAKRLGATEQEISQAAASLARTPGRGIVVVDDGNFVELRTAPQVAEKIEELRKEEFSRDIGRAGLEVLSAVMYRGPLSRAEIDFIRGVNSSQTLRTLLMRGFVRRVPNPRDERSFLYEPTTEILATLGVASMHDLPDYEAVRNKLTELESAYRQKEAEQTGESS
jgi:segregation and condensation protein B